MSLYFFAAFVWFQLDKNRQKMEKYILLQEPYKMERSVCSKTTKALDHKTFKTLANESQGFGFCAAEKKNNMLALKQHKKYCMSE